MKKYAFIASILTLAIKIPEWIGNDITSLLFFGEPEFPTEE